MLVSWKNSLEKTELPGAAEIVKIRLIFVDKSKNILFLREKNSQPSGNVY